MVITVLGMGWVNYIILGGGLGRIIPILEIGVMIKFSW